MGVQDSKPLYFEIHYINGRVRKLRYIFRECTLTPFTADQS